MRRRKRRPVELRGESSTTEDLSMLSRLSDARRDPTPTPKYNYLLKCVIIPAHVKLREIFSNVTSTFQTTGLITMSLVGTDFAYTHMEGLGWSKGKGLGKQEQGIVDALKPKLKFDQTGVGHNM